MRACIQRVSSASVIVENETVGQIEQGLLVLLGVADGDTEADLQLLARKIAELRIFEDAEERMNLSVKDVGGAIFVVSQFTLLANCRKGRRPSFTQAAPPEQANAYYQKFVELLRCQNIPVATGTFQAMMSVHLVNEGPVTIWLDTDTLKGPRNSKPES